MFATLVHSVTESSAIIGLGYLLTHEKDEERFRECWSVEFCFAGNKV